MDNRILEHRVMNLEEQFKKMAALAAADTQARHKAEALDVLTKIMSAAFDKMSAYTSLIVIGGYAAFFSVWGAVEKFVSPSVRLWTFGFVGLSALLFVLSEACRITKFNLDMQKWLRVLRDAPPAMFQTTHAELTRIQDRKNVEGFGMQRRIHYAVIGLAVIGAAILFCGIGIALWQKAKAGDAPPKTESVLAVLYNAKNMFRA